MLLIPSLANMYNKPWQASSSSLKTPYTLQYQTLVEVRIFGCKQLTVVVDNVMSNGDVVSEEMTEKDERVKGTRELIPAFMKLKCVEMTAVRTAEETNMMTDYSLQ